jgi:Superfamily II DNA and RNA helicases
LKTDFSSLPLSTELLTVLKELGYENQTPIQAASIPVLLEGKDLIGQSKTGSGKTAAYALPLLQNLYLEDKSLQILILCPTRELATQVVTEIRKLGRRLEGLQVLPLVGGVAGREQAQSLDRGVQIAVGTPGRVLDLISRGRMYLANIKTVVLDEADKMLDMGFEQELTALMAELPVQRQTALFSATFPDSIAALSKRYQKNPERIAIEDTSAEATTIEQFVYDAYPDDKPNMLMRILQQHPSNSTIIFCNMKATVKELAERFAEQNVGSGALHGDLEQRERDQVMALFRNGSYRILIATDVAARGLDIKGLELVVNFDMPAQAETHVHRIGRTGRAGKAGVAVTIADPRDSLKVLELEKITNQKMVRQNLGFKNQHGLNKEMREAAMQTLTISGGRKDKLRPGDILGALTRDVGIDGSEIGKIEIQDKISYVGISAKASQKAFEGLRNAKIKGQKFQIKLMK